jgi:hypothetical protein
MKIAFNMLECGLGNNGGTRTIIKCVEVLEKLGHRCDIIGTADNFTWFDHKPIIPHIPPDLDILIATACTDVNSTLQSDVPKKAWYIRAHENWAMSDEELGKRYNSGIFNVVNSKGLQQVLSSYGADSKIVYQGIDFDLWEDRNLRPKDKIRIGCLYTKQPRKRWKDFVKLSKILGHDDYEYVSIGNSKPKENFLTEVVYNVGHEKLCDIYNSCHIWFAPTENEGLHNVPMEANLCGCLVVCGDEPMNGMIYDYAFSNNTAMVYNRKDIEHAAELIRNPNWELIKNMQRHLRYHIGTRKDNMKKMVEYLENI